MSGSSHQGCTEGLARFISDHEQFPAQARSLAVDAVTDCIACIAGAVHEPIVPLLLQVVPSVSWRLNAAPERAATVIGLGRSAAAPDAAYLNGAMAHALDYDDITHPGYAHPSAVLVPALLAAGEVVNAKGSDLISAYIVGIETIGKLGSALNQEHYKRGWHATSTLGTMGAAAAAAHLIRLDSRRAAIALAIAASSAGGLRANFGTMTKPIHAGMAARNGAMAALMAQAGIDGCLDIIESPAGFAAVFESGKINWNALSDWGSRLEILSEYGIALKAYPCCGATHTAIEAAQILRANLAGRVDEIHRVRIGISEMARGPLLSNWPTTPLEAKFHIGYCVAVALLDGEVKLSTFAQERLSDPLLIQLMRRIEVYVDDRVRDDGEFASVVSLMTVKGTTMEELVLLAKGKPARRLNRGQLLDKFLDCNAFGNTVATVANAATRQFELLQSLDSDIAVRDVVDELAFSGASPPHLLDS